MKLALKLKRLRALADLLYSLKPERFNFSRWLEKTPCGTAACALGWAPNLPEAKRYGYKIGFQTLGTESFATFYKNDEEITPETFSSKFLGLGYDAHYYLFVPGGLNNGLKSDSTATTVAEHIRRFCQLQIG